MSTVLECTFLENETPIRKGVKYFEFSRVGWLLCTLAAVYVLRQLLAANSKYFTPLRIGVSFSNKVHSNRHKLGPGGTSTDT